MPEGRPHSATAWDSSSLDGLFQSSSTRCELRGSRLKAFYIRRAIHFMERHYPRELTVEEMAGACKLNRSYFSTIFKKNMGCPPSGVPHPPAAVQGRRPDEGNGKVYRSYRRYVRLFQPVPFLPGLP